MDIDNNREGHDDPQFVKVLETCLKMEIAASQKILDVNTAEIKQLKITIRSELDKRKELKGKMAQMNKIKLILNETLTRLYISINEVSDSLETIKANADDQYKLIQLRAQEYQDIIAEYKKTWHEYRAIYERFPLAKARNAAKVNLEKLKIEYMIMSYKKAEIMTIIKQRRHINWIRMRCKIIEFVTVMLERMKLEERLVTTKGNVKHHRNELQSIEAELQVLRRKEEDQQRQRKQKMLEMAPPKINIPFREMYVQNQMRARVQHQWKQIQEPFDDTTSVNTLFLEELCINENATVSPERMDIDTTHDNNYNKPPAADTEMSNSKSAIVSDNDNTRPASVAFDTEPSAEKATSVDSDVEMKETHHDEIQKSQESVKTQPSCCTKENPLKHNIAKNPQNEIEAKRIRLQRQDSKRSINKITTPQPSTIVKEMSLGKSSPRSVPKIKKIETVHYNITPLIPKPIQRSTVTASSMFSPIMHYEYCDSNMSSFDQDFMSKGAPSFYEESLCNYRLSPTSNLSICPEEDVPMQQDNKPDKTSNERTSPFDFSDFTKKAKDDFSLF
ncbi:uncharacterized protein LOC118648228 [Monomorium pharaonis]|uniref:uncharacterized protein LOC118648228 n=1 Tax=Monomorium pharaonis TaxID=307658 RepID=UPI001747BE88|nr:uncharacterized protein LOC118648228 [Monomorium pharaonis]